MVPLIHQHLTTMLRGKVCVYLYRCRRRVKHLVILSAFIVTLVVMGEILTPLDVTDASPVVSKRGDSAPPAERHLNLDVKSTKTKPEVPVAEHQHNAESVLVKERKLNINEHELALKSHYADQAASNNSAALTTRSAETQDKLLHGYLINEPHLCLKTRNLYIINLVSATPQDHQNRSLIRQLWGNEKWTHITGFKTVFLLGEAKDPHVMAAVREESETYHDIIQFSFLDSYDNLTFKVLSGLHWVENFCPTPVWVLKSDTDVLVNVFLMNRFLHTHDEATKHSRNQFLCWPVWRVVPCRPEDCLFPKWFISWEEYPYATYPTYCRGAAYILPRRMVGPLYDAANKTHPFRIEDVYYTGIIPKRIQWQSAHKSISKYFSWKPKRWRNSFSNTDLLLLELDTRLGQNASVRVWLKILQNQGL